MINGSPLNKIFEKSSQWFWHQFCHSKNEELNRAFKNWRKCMLTWTLFFNHHYWSSFFCLSFRFEWRANHSSVWNWDWGQSEKVCRFWILDDASHFRCRARRRFREQLAGLKFVKENLLKEENILTLIVIRLIALVLRRRRIVEKPFIIWCRLF